MMGLIYRLVTLLAGFFDRVDLYGCYNDWHWLSNNHAELELISAIHQDCAMISRKIRLGSTVYT